MNSRWLWPGLAILLVLILSTSFGFGFRSFLLADASVTSPSSASETGASTSASRSPQLVLASHRFRAAAAPSSRDVMSPRDAADEKETAAQPALDGEEPPSVPPSPPVPDQGGTCISGFVIDRYRQTAGAGWNVTVTSEEGASQEQTVNADGYVGFGGLGAGTWTVELEVPEGWRPFTGASFPVTLSGTGDNCASVRFKVEALACLDVIKLDADGEMGFSQMVGIPGWHMTAQHGDDTPLTAVTDWEGKCRFDNLVPGTWTVEEEDKTGWVPAPGQTSEKTVELESPRTPGACESVTFVNQQVQGACIYALKLDSARNPVAGWQMTVKRDDGTQPSLTKTTDSSGYATFCGLALGDWTVEEESKDWWRPVGPAVQHVELTERGSYEVVVFENEPLGCIDGYKINHLDQGLPGWTVVARNQETGEEHTAVTDEHGYFRFMGLGLGTWTVSETLQTGWEPVTPPELQVEVAEPFKCEHVRFKNETEFACLDVFKRDSADGAGLPGWEITVHPAYGGDPIAGTTDGTGHVRFNGLAPGTYDVSEEMQEEWVAVTPTSQRVTLQATGSCRVITFENRQETDPQPEPDPPGGGCRAYHRVRWGDTLFSIARWYGTTVAALRQANGLYYNTIWAGQTLCIP